MLFQKFDFEVVVNPGKYNVGLDHLSRLESRETETILDDELPYAHLLKVETIP
jgi:hypothetical protein